MMGQCIGTLSHWQIGILKLSLPNTKNYPKRPIFAVVSDQAMRFSGIKTFFRRWKIRGYLLLKWVSERITQRNYLIIVSIVIGVAAGLVAGIMKWSVHHVRIWLHGSDPTTSRWGFVLFPVVGILLTVVFVRYLLRKPLDAGLASLIFSLSRKRVDIAPFETYAHIIGSSLTVGAGGSVGLESPIIRTGAAVGANLARLMGVGRKKQVLFLACGAAAGLGAIFNSPVAGVIFAFEILVTDIAVASFIPLLIAAASGAVVAKIFYYEQIFFLPVQEWRIEALPFYLLLGIFTGVNAAYIIRSLSIGGKRFAEWFQPTYLRIIAGGLFLGLMIFLMPPLFGEGYDTINALLAGRVESVLEHSPFYWLSGHPWFIVGFTFLVVLAKPWAAALTVASGGSGGKFAPSMFYGALLGFAFAYGVNQLGWVQLNISNFIAVAMAGIISGVFKSPLTGIFLIAEITGGYVLFVPLMIVSALSYFVSNFFEPNSIFTRDLVRQGIWAPAHERDRNILHNMSVLGLVETDFRTLKPEQTLGEFVKIIANSRRNVFPVIGENRQFKGIVLLDDVREIMFNKDQYDKTKVANVMHNAPDIVDISDPMEKVMQKFEYHQAWNLPVVDKGRYLGFVSKSSIFNKYRELLIDRSQDV